MLLSEIVARLGGELRGDGSIDIAQVAPLDRAQGNEIGFVAQKKYADELQQTAAGAVILPEALAAGYAGTCIVTAEPHLYFARLAQVLNPPDLPAPGIHPTAVVLSAIPTSARIAANVFIDENCVLGENVSIGPGCVLERGVVIGDDSSLRANVTICHGSVIGKRCIFNPGSVVGSDGFGYARHRDGRWEKVPQIGRVVIGDEVEIGANTTIDRGALDDTVIERGVKLDNLVHIAHNCQVGENSAFAAFVGIAGSTSVGKRVMLGGQVGVNGHIEICDDVIVSGGTSITKTIKEGGVYTAVLQAEPHMAWMKNAARFRQLDEMARKLRDLEKKLNDLENSK